MWAFVSCEPHPHVLLMAPGGITDDMGWGRVIREVKPSLRLSRRTSTLALHVIKFRKRIGKCAGNGNLNASRKLSRATHYCDGGEI